MNIPGARRIEPFKDKEGSPGFIVIDAVGDINILKTQDYSQLNEQDKKTLDLQANAALQWRLPLEPDMSKFSAIREEIIRDGVKPGKEWEAYDEYVRNILTPLSGRIQRFLNTFCYFEDERIYPLLSSFVISSYFKEQFEKMPLILIDGVSGSGKSTVLAALSEVCYRGFSTSNYSTASLVDMVEYHDVTILLDESLRNINSERGTDLNTLLINSFDKKTAVYTRKDLDLGRPTVKRHFTPIAVTRLGGEIPEDMRNRAAMINMTLPDENIDLEDIGYINDAGLNYECHPDSIRTDLFSLKLMTESDRIRKIEDPALMRGIVFDNLRQTTKRYLEHKDPDSGRYLYGIVYGISYTPKITGRDKAIAYVHHAIGLATGDDSDIISYIISNRESIFDHKTETTESVLMMALSDLIYDRHIELFPPMKGQPMNISGKEICRICNKISLPDIYKKYGDLRRLEGWNDKEIESARSLSQTFRKLRIPYEERGGRTNYLNAFRDEFIQKFKKAAAQYLDPERASIYQGIEPFSASPLQKEGE